MRLAAAGCVAVRPLTGGPARTARWLGVSASAAYLGVPAEYPGVPAKRPGLPAEYPGRPAGESGGRASGALTVVAVLARDAVRLPCGLRLATTGAELPLTSLVPAPSARGAGAAEGRRNGWARLDGPAMAAPVGNGEDTWPGPARSAIAAPVIGNGEISWPGPDGPVVVRVASEWAPRRVRQGAVSAGALAEVRALLPPEVPGIGRALLDALRKAAGTAAGDLAGTAAVDPAGTAAVDLAGTAAGDLAGTAAGNPAGSAAGDPAGTAVAGLLGRGEGLTPSGDDVLAGFLAGASAFRIPIAGLRRAVSRRATATTALSAQLLRHAADGECIDEVADLAAVLTGRGEASLAARRLLAVGHSSGAALACGLLLAAECALRPGPALAGGAAGHRPAGARAGTLAGAGAP